MAQCKLLSFFVATKILPRVSLKICRIFIFIIVNYQAVTNNTGAMVFRYLKASSKIKKSQLKSNLNNILQALMLKIV